MMQWINKLLFGSTEKGLVLLRQQVAEINTLEPELEILPADELLTYSQALRERLGKGENLFDLLVPAFALVREASRRTLGQRHFDVQLLGGMILASGKIAEMRTGEGKTLTATLPAYLHGLTGQGVHIVTVNDYLAQRDAVWMGQIYAALGLRVACLVHDQALAYDASWRDTGQAVAQDDKERDVLGSFRVVHDFLRPVSRQEAYACDIVYGTNHEFGFDYLRDNLVYASKDLVQREPYYALIDEVDSILIDEARTPLIISGPAEDAGKIYKEFSRIAPKLEREQDYQVDEKRRQVFFTDAGLERINRILGRDIFEENNLVLIHHLERALEARSLYRRDKDYVVKDGEIVIVDEFTGRLLFGRRYERGLHQALEAKEGLRVQNENRTLATITLQNYFRLYPTLAGMTGTALTSAEEFHKVYNLEVLAVPTNQPMIRRDLPDKVFLSEKAKLLALTKEIKERNRRGQPVLVGTASIEKNERLSALLGREGVRHDVLNAKAHEREAEIIAQAGKKSSVTVATNMAGRGVDIILGGNPPDPQEAEEIKQEGGLHVIGTERHESRRIDNQLRGRSGRQGDPGSTQFFVSLEDDLMRIFGAEQLKGLLARLGMGEETELELENKFVSQALNNVQQKVEGLNFDIRKTVLEYDDVLNKQRATYYQKRRKILTTDTKGLDEAIRLLSENAVGKILTNNQENLSEVVKLFSALLTVPQDFSSKLEGMAPPERQAYLLELVSQELAATRTKLGEKAEFTLRANILSVFDFLWTEHLETMVHLADSARLQAYGQRDSLVVYKTEGHRLFKELLEILDLQTFLVLLRINKIVQ